MMDIVHKKDTWEPTFGTYKNRLCFIVLSGEGELSYEEQTYQLGEGDCVFNIKCQPPGTKL